jgi:hypothetical protein
MTQQERPNDMQQVTVVLEALVSDETGADLRAHPMAEWPAVRSLLADCEPTIRVVAVAPATTAAGDSTVAVSRGTQSSPDPHPWNCPNCGKTHGPLEACLLGLLAAVVRDRGEVSAEALATACEQTSTDEFWEMWGDPAADELEGLAKKLTGSRGG